MKKDALPPLQNIQSLYLNAHAADVWFTIYDDRVPGHKLILGAMCPYYRTMFYGLLPESNVVNMTEAVGSVESFREFLKFMYFLQPNLTMDNIEDVISLAKQSLSVECLSICEMFLKKSITDDLDTIFRVYRLAILYDLEDLKMMCSDYVCVYADQVLKSSDELRDVIHQIRFTSMNKSDASRCIRSYPGLFTANELKEIICMVAKDDRFQPKQFNWTPRYFDMNWNKGRFLKFSLFDQYDEKHFLARRNETTRFTCNRWVILKSFSYQLNFLSPSPIRVYIMECTGENKIIRFDKTLHSRFRRQHSLIVEMDIVLNKPIVLRPKYCYEIVMEFQNDWIVYASNHSQCRTIKRVDHDIVFDFEENNIVSGLSIYRLDNKNYFQKVFHNPKTWIALFCVGIAGAAYFKINGAVPVASTVGLPVVPIVPTVPVAQSQSVGSYVPRVIAPMFGWFF